VGLELFQEKSMCNEKEMLHYHQDVAHVLILLKHVAEAF
jgi:hypothetical protein